MRIGLIWTLLTESTVIGYIEGLTATCGAVNQLVGLRGLGAGICSHCFGELQIATKKTPGICYRLGSSLGEMKGDRFYGAMQ